MSPTLATPANMRLAAATSRAVFAWSPYTGETYSATADDYFNQPDNEPLLDEDDEPMLLVYRRSEYIDALTGETL